MNITDVLTMMMTRPGTYTVCRGAGVLVGYCLYFYHTKDPVRTIYIRDGARSLLRIMVPREYPLLMVNLTKLPGMREGIPFETSLVVELEVECNMEIGYVLTENAFDR